MSERSVREKASRAERGSGASERAGGRAGGPMGRTARTFAHCARYAVQCAAIPSGVLPTYFQKAIVIIEEEAEEDSAPYINGHSLDHGNGKTQSLWDELGDMKSRKPV